MLEMIKRHPILFSILALSVYGIWAAAAKRLGHLSIFLVIALYFMIVLTILAVTR